MSVTTVARQIPLVALTIAAAVGGCGTTSTVHTARPAGANPSVSATMICRPETQTEIAKNVFGQDTIRPVTPTWVAHRYSCQYAYPFGTLTLSVKELPDKAATTAYYHHLRTTLGEQEPLDGLGQGGFSSTNGSAVVRKDYKILDVDVAGLPAQFGSPPSTRADAAISVAAIIMGCWTGN